MPSTHKICDLGRLLELRRLVAGAGRKVVHCHGCFDIVHPGHVRHLEFARSLGDVLVVSVSADPQVNKGAARPLIPEDLRAGNLAALECVDWVYVNPHPTAVELLEALRPDVYVKGKEYEHNQDPRFLAERDAVIGHGGRVVFSSGDLVLSSTNLIGSMSEPRIFNAEKVRRLRQRYELSSASLHQLVMRFRGRRVLVVGDYILDRYHLCEATGVASDSPMLALRAIRRMDYDGGAGVIARHLAGLGAEPTLVTSLGSDDGSAQVEANLADAGVAVFCPRRRKQSPVHGRYVAGESKLFRVDEGSAAPLDSAEEASAARMILDASRGADAVIFADFGYGLITAGLLDRVMAELRQRVPVLTADVSGRQSTLLRFKSVDLLCPTEQEMRQTMNDFSSGLNAVVYGLLKTTGASNAIITMGKEGLVAFDFNPEQKADQSWERRLRSEYLPALAGRAVDSLGAGDALLAMATLAMACGASLQAAAFLGALAASIEVEQLGNQPIEVEQVLARLHECSEVVAKVA